MRGYNQTTMKRVLRLALAAVLTASFAAVVPAPAAAKRDCCGGSCPMPSKKAPVKKAKCCRIAPAVAKDSAVLVRLPVVSRPGTVSVAAPVLRPVAVVSVSAAPPARVFDEAPSGLSPPARA